MGIKNIAYHQSQNEVKNLTNKNKQIIMYSKSSRGQKSLLGNEQTCQANYIHRNTTPPPPQKKKTLVN